MRPNPELHTERQIRITADPPDTSFLLTYVKMDDNQPVWYIYDGERTMTIPPEVASDLLYFLEETV